MWDNPERETGISQFLQQFKCGKLHLKAQSILEDYSYYCYLKCMTHYTWSCFNAVQIHSCIQIKSDVQVSPPLASQH